MMLKTHGVAQRAVRRDRMVAQDAVLFRAQPLDAAPALLVEEMRAEFHRDAVELLEGMRERQQFALRVERAALHALGIPGRTDLDAAVRRIDIHVGGHARDLAVGVEHRPRQHRACLLQAETAVDLLAHVLRLRHEGVPQLPQLAVLHRLDQSVMMILRQRFEPRMRTLQGYRFKPRHHISSLLIPRSASLEARLEGLVLNLLMVRDASQT